VVQTFSIPFDVRAEVEVQTAIDLVVEEWGRIDFAVNCAGTFVGRETRADEGFANSTRTNSDGDG
jgi:NAD(P)-dependent dehydrogenase (short-subunit alcohol dehydrogenase family)